MKKYLTLLTVVVGILTGCSVYDIKTIHPKESSINKGIGPFHYTYMIHPAYTGINIPFVFVKNHEEAPYDISMLIFSDEEIKANIIIYESKFICESGEIYILHSKEAPPQIIPVTYTPHSMFGRELWSATYSLGKNIDYEFKDGAHYRLEIDMGIEPMNLRETFIDDFVGSHLKGAQNIFDYYGSL